MIDYILNNWQAIAVVAFIVIVFTLNYILCYEIRRA